MNFLVKLTSNHVNSKTAIHFFNRIQIKIKFFYPIANCFGFLPCCNWDEDETYKDETYTIDTIIGRRYTFCEILR